MLDGVDVSDSQCVGNKRARSGSTPGTYADTDGAGVLNQVGDDEEVGRVALHVDDFDFVLRPIYVFLRHLATVEAILKPLHHLVSEPTGGCMPIWNVGDWHAIVGVWFPDFTIILDTFGNQQRVVTSTRNHVIPGNAHFFRRLDVVAVAVEFETIGVSQGFTGLNTQHGLMGFSLAFEHIVTVVGHQWRQIQLATNLQQLAADSIFDVQPVVHQLKEVIFLAVNILPHGCGFECFIELPKAQTGLHVAGRAASGSDNAGGVFGDKFRVHAGPFAQLAFVGCHG